MRLPSPVLERLVQGWAYTKRARVHYENGRIRITRGQRAILIPRAHLPFVRVVVEQFDVFWSAVDHLDGVVDYSTPARHRYRDTGLDFWLPSLPEEPDAIRAYFRYGGPAVGALAFDVGAHSGVATYALSQAVGPSGHIVAFEPDPIAYEYLRRNVVLHSLTNVTTVPMALAGTSGVRRFNREGSLGSSFADMIDRHGKMVTVDVVCLSFADAVARYGVPSFAKIDIEGAELEVLEAAVDLFRVHPITCVLDTGHVIDGALTADRVEAIFRRAGYRATTHRGIGGTVTYAGPP
jgi:FkbM family methyltransferase